MAEAKATWRSALGNRLIEMIKAGTAPWMRPWTPGIGFGLPHNGISGHRYRGANLMMLLGSDYSDPRWFTYRQAAAKGAQVRKGEKGTTVQYWKRSSEEDAQADGKIKAKTKVAVFYATVFNAAQIDGLPAIHKEQTQTWNTIERAENILRSSGASITHAKGSAAYYHPVTDTIHLPDVSQFPTADGYYAVALHELGHWTGHSSRLDRDLSNPFGSNAYAKEELRAEIASMIMGSEYGVGHDPGQHAAYVKSWLSVLADDPGEILKAVSDAEKICNFISQFDFPIEATKKAA